MSLSSKMPLMTNRGEPGAGPAGTKGDMEDGGPTSAP